jgi:hypothetical protein
MKKLTLMASFLQVCLATFGQISGSYPIPSYNVPVDSGDYACFNEATSAARTPDALEKKDVHIRILSSNPETPGCQATVWLYSLDGLDVLGPYTVLCGDELVVTVDDREWGVIVSSQYDVTVDVWIE